MCRFSKAGAEYRLHFTHGDHSAVSAMSECWGQRRFFMKKISVANNEKQSISYTVLQWWNSLCIYTQRTHGSLPTTFSLSLSGC